MRNQETSLGLLADFLPDRTFDMVLPFFKNYKVHLTLTRERKSVLGDYRNATRDYPYHRISINVNLNKYNFLITLLHELAHMLTYEHFKDTVPPHGKEWKTQFRHILVPFMGKRFFPADVEAAVMGYLRNPAASTCTDPKLYKALYRYDEPKPGYLLVDDVKPNGVFEIEDGRRFQKVESLRTRSRCKELSTGRMYFFQGIVEVRTVRGAN